MPPDCGVRAAAETDVSAIQQIYAHYVRTHTATFEEEPPSVEAMLGRWREVRASGLPWLVAENAGRVVGYGYAGAYRPRRAYRFTCEDSIYIAPEWSGRGIGSALLGGVIAQCEAGGWREMIAVIGDSANEPSVRLHRRHGFLPVGVFRAVGFKFGRWLDTVLMQRPLGEGGNTKPREFGS